ncbi:MAG: hypothetical protein WC790_02025 [Candidatus Paceibacterota bacterium]
MIRTAFWTFVFILALSFFGVSIQAIIESPAGQANIQYLLTVATSFWQWLTSFVLSLNVGV